MELPNVATELIDPETQVKFRVMAYRRLEQAELLSAVRAALRHQKKKPAKNSVVTIVTTIGLNG